MTIQDPQDPVTIGDRSTFPHHMTICAGKMEQPGRRRLCGFSTDTLQHGGWKAEADRC